MAKDMDERFGVLTAEKYYHHSGRFGPGGLIFMLLAGCLVGAVLGPVYALAVRYVPLVFISVLLTIGFGVGVGFVVGFASRLGKVRNVWIVGTAGLICAAVGWYVSWAIWIFAISEYEILTFAPADIWYLAGEIAKVGVWSLSGDGDPVKGVFLIVVWVAEALIILCTGAYVAFLVNSGKAFCERCNCWLGSRNFKPFGGLDDPTSLPDRLERGDIGVLENLHKLAADATEFVSFDLASCPACREMFLLSGSYVVIRTDKKNKPTTNTTPLFRKLIVDGQVRQRIEQLSMGDPRAEG